MGQVTPGLLHELSTVATWRLAELVGEPVAKEILLAGRVLKADEALDLHLVSELVEPDDLLAAGHRLADRIAAHAPLAVRLTKAVFHAPRDAHRYIDDLAQAVLFETSEKQERMTEFLTKNQQKDQRSAT